MNLQDIYRTKSRRLQSMLARMLGSYNDAEDLAHDAFLRAYVAELGDRTELSSALLTVTARRLALNEIRKRTRRSTDMVGDMDSSGVYSSDDPGAAIENSELKRSIHRAMEAMPPQCRQVFRMRKIDDMSHLEIASALGISPKTVERHIGKAIKICRATLIEDGHGGELQRAGQGSAG